LAIVYASINKKNGSFSIQIISLYTMPARLLGNFNKTKTIEYGSVN
jgi:hypothetical protein